jgi:hypothetical protein
MVFNATVNNISVILSVSFIGGGNRSTRRKKTTDLPQVTDKRLYRQHSGVFFIVKPSHGVTSIKQSQVLKGHLFIVLS